jgi:hypothetical protein
MFTGVFWKEINLMNSKIEQLFIIESGSGLLIARDASNLRRKYWTWLWNANCD